MLNHRDRTSVMFVVCFTVVAYHHTHTATDITYAMACPSVVNIIMHLTLNILESNDTVLSFISTVHFDC